MVSLTGLFNRGLATSSFGQNAVFSLWNLTIPVLVYISICIYQLASNVAFFFLKTLSTDTQYAKRYSLTTFECIIILNVGNWLLKITSENWVVNFFFVLNCVSGSHKHSIPQFCGKIPRLSPLYTFIYSFLSMYCIVKNTSCIVINTQFLRWVDECWNTWDVVQYSKLTSLLLIRLSLQTQEREYNLKSG